MTVVVPTLAADETLDECLASLERQTFSDFEVIVVDNSGRSAVAPRDGVRVIANDRNVGFGAAVNQAFRESKAPFLAVLNDDARRIPAGWKRCCGQWKRGPTSACAPRKSGTCGRGPVWIRRACCCAETEAASSAGIWNRPHPIRASRKCCCPAAPRLSIAAKCWKKSALFDESFFLYCEDTDLGLRARWAAWECLYVPDAVVEHRYSHSAGKASALKAYYVERNRLFLIFKNFPFMDLLLVPFYAIARYFWHFVLCAARTRQGRRVPATKAAASVSSCLGASFAAHLAIAGRDSRVFGGSAAR